MTKTILFTLLTTSTIAFAQVPPVPQAPPIPQAAQGPGSVNGAQNPVGDTTISAKKLSAKMNEQAVVHLNTATPEQLAKLPGIGPVKAKAIIDARPFKSVEDLKNVKGIKEGVFNKIKSMVAL